MLRQFCLRYQADHHYQHMVTDLTSVNLSTLQKEVLNTTKISHPFYLKDSLLYNTNTKGKIHLYIPYTLIPKFLASIYNDKHHFRHKRMAKDLLDVQFHSKTRLIRN